MGLHSLQAIYRVVVEGAVVVDVVYSRLEWISIVYRQHTGSWWRVLLLLLLYGSP